MMTASGTIRHNLKTAVLARSSNNARAHRSRRSLATSMRMHATRLESPKGTLAFERSSNARKAVEMYFAHLKVQHGLERMHLRGLSGTPDLCRTSRHSRRRNRER